jgi:hypothetical protein
LYRADGLLALLQLVQKLDVPLPFVLLLNHNLVDLAAAGRNQELASVGCRQKSQTSLVRKRKMMSAWQFVLLLDEELVDLAAAGCNQKLACVGGRQRRQVAFVIPFAE